MSFLWTVYKVTTYISFTKDFFIHWLPAFIAAKKLKKVLSIMKRSIHFQTSSYECSELFICVFLFYIYTCNIVTV